MNIVDQQQPPNYTNLAASVNKSSTGSSNTNEYLNRNTKFETPMIDTPESSRHKVKVKHLSGRNLHQNFQTLQNFPSEARNGYQNHPKQKQRKISTNKNSFSPKQIKGRNKSNANKSQFSHSVVFKTGRQLKLGSKHNSKDKITSTDTGGLEDPSHANAMFSTGQHFHKTHLPMIASPIS